MPNKVTVWMSAYNHEKYITQCLDGVLNQKTNFDFDIVLGEDCSTDRTREIVSKYAENNPGKFKLHLPEKNIGMMNMDIATWKLCTGEYIASLNGDDLWTDENKLQIQSDFLDDNPDTVMCYHKALVENENDGSSFETVYPESGNELTTENLLLGYNPVMTPTVMFKRILDIPDWFEEMPYGDMPLYLLLAQKGKIKYIDKLMSIYRIHPGGDWQGHSMYSNLLKDIFFYEYMNKFFNFKFDEKINRIFAQRYFELIRLNIKEGNSGEAAMYFEKLKAFHKEFMRENKSDIDIIHAILFENGNKDNYPEFFARGIKWKVN